MERPFISNISFPPSFQADRSRRTRFILSCLTVILSGMPFPAHAVIVAVPDNVTSPVNLHQTTPANGAPWDHVGNIVGANGSAVYLGNGWAITAKHVGVTGNFELNGTTYTSSGPSVELAGVDMELFQLDTLPPESGVRLRETPVTTGEQITLIGYGFNRNSGEIPLTIDGFLADGYERATTNLKTWGTNQVTAVNLLFPAIGTGFTADFDDPHPGLNNAGADSDEAIATLGDSGSAAFTFDGLQWELAGLTVTASSINQANTNYVFYSQPNLESITGFLAIDNQRTTIQVTIPEPASACLMLLAVILLCRPSFTAGRQFSRSTFYS
ncbi:MAG: hypothetical protein CMJ81_08775 [Planctomycetaceae bacterium]|nr:hypothetical protein [Planctomycetaceae bacterium]MBP61919.1 hypothetical protein [Planctomycetaceae bacterium]